MNELLIVKMDSRAVQNKEKEMIRFQRRLEIANELIGSMPYIKPYNEILLEKVNEL